MNNIKIKSITKEDIPVWIKLSGVKKGNML
jgi:hypothetical protein